MMDALPESGFEETVRHRAYALWESEGRPAGRHTEHWQLCEAITRAELNIPALQKLARKAAPRKKAAASPKRVPAAVEHRASH